MKGNTLTGAVVIVVVVACAGTWLLPSMLQSPERAVAVGASLELERARRLLDKYDAQLAYKSLLVSSLADEDIEVDPEGVSDDVADEYESIHTQMWESYQPVDWRGDRRTPANSNYGDIDGDIASGVRGCDKLTQYNDGLLEEASAAVGRALSFSAGSVSARNHAQANRLKAVILYHRGLAVWTEALLERREVDRVRERLAGLVTTAHSWLAAQNLVEDSGIDHEITKLSDEIAREQQAIEGAEASLEESNDRIADLESWLVVASEELKAARAELDRLRANSLDFFDPHSGETFQRNVENQNRRLRAAARRAQTLERGAYPHATIDDSGDFLAGEYIENGSKDNLTITFGLDHERQARKLIEDELKTRKYALADFQAALTRLQDSRVEYQAEEDRARKELQQSARGAAEAHEELIEADALAVEIEDEALDFFDQSARVASQAASQSGRWVRTARDRTSGLSPEAKSRSAFSVREDDSWIEGFAQAQQADALLAIARIHYERYVGALQNQIVMSSAGSAFTDLDVESESLSQDPGTAHDSGVEAITEAMTALRKAHGKVAGHWTLTAHAAGATYLMSLFGHDGYLDDALEAYRTAIAGRETEPAAAVFAARLDYLESKP